VGGRADLYDPGVSAASSGDKVARDQLPPGGRTSTPAFIVRRRRGQSFPGDAPAQTAFIILLVLHTQVGDATGVERGVGEQIPLRAPGIITISHPSLRVLGFW
jgi:hypothetical protein